MVRYRQEAAMTNFYFFCRNVHRFIALVAAVLLTFMAGTGTLLYFPKIADVLPLINLGYVRYIHGSMAPWAALAVFLMAGTGFFLYIFPLWQRRKQIT